MLHGSYLTINHAFAGLKKPIEIKAPFARWSVDILSCSITFLAVVIAWVLFRAENVSDALSVYKSMAGLSGLEGHDYQNNLYKEPMTAENIVCMCLLFIFLLPNSLEFFKNYLPKYNQGISFLHIRWKPTAFWAGVCAIMMFISLASLYRISEFLYFQF